MLIAAVGKEDLAYIYCKVLIVKGNVVPTAITLLLPVAWTRSELSVLMGDKPAVKTLQKRTNQTVLHGFAKAFNGKGCCDYLNQLRRSR